MHVHRTIALVIAVALGAGVCPALAASAKAGGAAVPASRGHAGGRVARAPVRSSGRQAAAAVTLASAHCVPIANCSSDPTKVQAGGRLLLSGHGLAAGMTVTFPRAPHTRRRSPTATIRRSSLGWLVAVPSAAHSGRIYVTYALRRHSNQWGPIRVVRYRLHPPRAGGGPALGANGATSGTAFDGQGMWIWYVSKSSAGNLATIVSQAHAAGVSTLFVKSSDGSSNYWSQFSPALVQTLHANGLKVCGWQYVYGSNPAGEANLGAQAVAAGADCLVIDAEAEYEGRYAAAQTYIRTLRGKVGLSYPVGLASFPYVYYHQSEPYSVFLGPGGAQYNAPQMYWKDIGNSVDTVYANTYISNRIYLRPLFPLGQTYNNPSRSDLVRFRDEAVDYGATGVSWWDYQETTASGWSALATPLAPLTSVIPNSTWPDLSSGSKGDQVLWMQEHLASAVPSQATSGIFDAQTTANLESFQQARGLPISGHTDAATWQALLALTPVAVNWSSSARASRASAGAALISRGVRVARAPASASLPAVRDEISAPGRGGRPGH
jgi:putative peptidoglycan binding protein